MTYRSYVVHSQYNPSNFANDVAVITIRGSFNGRTNVRQIALQESEPVISSVNPTACFVVGWGWINLNGQLADRLQRGNFVLMPQATCASRVPQVTSSTICAQSLQGDACRGDSGGPLVCNNRLYGIVSFGPRDCNGAIPMDSQRLRLPAFDHSFVRMLESR
ncbi:trypsin alpha-4-like [Anopheles albimanus]|uniref:trypsin alpha-4-like n=1 Tax=Anopheles albimanus TaxID=7167 RepID=UPI0016403DF3|nr:trypsin alpha-4-like [Anopheles albimanus]